MIHEEGVKRGQREVLGSGTQSQNQRQQMKFKYRRFLLNIIKSLYSEVTKQWHKLLREVVEFSVQEDSKAT